MNFKFLALPTVLFCTAASAQMPAGMSEQDMQKMMAAMQEVQACFQKVDQKEVSTLQQQSMEFASAIETLCKDGKRDAAQDFARDFYNAMMASKTVKQLKACAEKIPESLKSAVKAPMDFSQLNIDKTQHVCDS